MQAMWGMIGSVVLQVLILIRSLYLSKSHIVSMILQSSTASGSWSPVALAQLRSCFTHRFLSDYGLVSKSTCMYHFWDKT